MKRDAAEYESMARAAMSETPDFQPTGPVEIRMGRGRGKGNSPTVTVRFTPEVRDELHRRAERENISISDLIRKASSEYLRSHPA